MSDGTPSTPETPGNEAVDANSPESQMAEDNETVQETQAHQGQSPGDNDGSLTELTNYARGLLKIRVPVRVTLASQRKSIQEIIELGPGSIVRFDKTCEEPLELTVGDRPIAMGEVVKVGDKFGLRIGGLITT
jgi:flagellar motor switch protein FliN/FliY